MKILSDLGLGLRRQLPTIVQSEATECGLASVAMVAIYHGYRTDLSTLRLRFAISSKGATLEGLVRIARALSLDTRALKLDMDALDQLSLPCVIHWDMNHFVVLRSVSKRRIVVHDPAVGVRHFTPEQFSRHFTGIALELSPASDFTPQTNRMKFTVRSLMGRVTGLRRGLVQVLLLAVALEVLAIAAPFHLQWVIDRAVGVGDQGLLSGLALGFGMLVLLQGAITAMRSWFVVSLSTSLNFQWLGNVLSHLLRLPLEFFERRHIGHVLSSFSSITTIQHTLTTGFVEALVDGVMVLGTLLMMVSYSPRLAALSLATVLLYALLRISLYRVLRGALAEEILYAAKQNTHFIDTVRGIQSVRLFGREEHRRAGWLNMLADELNAHLRIQRITIHQKTAQVLLFGIERVLIVWLAARAVIDGSFTVGTLLAYIAYKEQFSTRVAALVDKAIELAMLGIHAERVADVVLHPREAESPHAHDDIDLNSVAPAIELKNLSFRYSPTEPLVFEGVDLAIAAGECVAITGASGGGKTTLVKVMLGLLTPSSGTVMVGGRPIQQLGVGRYRRMIGTVMQGDHLFSGSLSDNICFFDPTPDVAFIEACAIQASIHDEILQMPMGYNTLIGDLGSGLSGGQVQRVLLARAFYRRPRILVLDEATSSLDIEGERRVNNAVRAMRLTRIVIAHRPETIAMADRVITLEDGRLVQRSPRRTHAATTATQSL